MQVSARITVKGTRYYKSAELLRNGSLAPGVAIRLEHQPLNPHDSNAVAVCVKSTGAMLGHISKDLASKYAALVSAGKIISAKVSSIDKSDRVDRAPGRAGRRSQSMRFPFERRKVSSTVKSDLTVKVLVIYEQSDEHLDRLHASRLWLSASALPTGPGVYSIRNLISSRQYVGSSANVRQRIHDHVKQLRDGVHHNERLLSDFSKQDADQFEASILDSNQAAEAATLRKLLNAGTPLYNLTEDGEGRRPSTRGRGSSETISDKLVRERANAEWRLIEERLDNKKKEIISRFDPRLAELRPSTNVLFDRLSRVFRAESYERASVQYRHLLTQRDGELEGLERERDRLQGVHLRNQERALGK